MTNTFKSAVMAATAVAAISFGATSANAATATGDATARIVDALQITQNNALNFGIIVPTTGAATVEVTPAGGKICGAGLSCISGTHASGSYTVTGLGGQGVDVSVSAPTTLTGPAGSTAMTLAGLSTSSNSVTLSAGATGTANFSVGGILTVGANQMAGTYNGTFTVTANYQ